MITIKSYTDIEQSCKLAEILSIESADFQSKTIESNADVDVDDVSYVIYPCWSLAALLGVLPMIDFTTPQLVGTPKTLYRCMYDDNLKSHACDNHVDACYELILKLHEQKLL